MAINVDDQSVAGLVGVWWSTLEICKKLTRLNQAGHGCTRRRPGQHQLVASEKSSDKVASEGLLSGELIGLVYEDVAD